MFASSSCVTLLGRKMNLIFHVQDDYDLTEAVECVKQKALKHIHIILCKKVCDEVILLKLWFETATSHQCFAWQTCDDGTRTDEDGWVQVGGHLGSPWRSLGETNNARLLSGMFGLWCQIRVQNFTFQHWPNHWLQGFWTGYGSSRYIVCHWGVELLVQGLQCCRTELYHASLRGRRTWWWESRVVRQASHLPCILCCANWKFTDGLPMLLLLAKSHTHVPSRPTARFTFSLSLWYELLCAEVHVPREWRDGVHGETWDMLRWLLCGLQLLQRQGLGLHSFLLPRSQDWWNHWRKGGWSEHTTNPQGLGWLQKGVLLHSRYLCCGLSEGCKCKSQGWTAGPYISVRLRLLWGPSSKQSRLKHFDSFASAELPFWHSNMARAHAAWSLHHSLT